MRLIIFVLMVSFGGYAFVQNTKQGRALAQVGAGHFATVPDLGKDLVAAAQSLLDQMMGKPAQMGSTFRSAKAQPVVSARPQITTKSDVAIALELAEQPNWDAINAKLQKQIDGNLGAQIGMALSDPGQRSAAGGARFVKPQPAE